ncbi:hypothetical protein PQJ75_14020 [Rhodoplanes sp. TEM]|uniref:Uncharacterized protein n=1 Tax=Rhodoplanes tepidamans TaxID=200616 RepID=A0ABT5JEH2_RHOTP|nr:MULTISPECIES: hypothetical protein [Rhodoplanes]MDC7788009.1 hypothetical protein [Rhodoplanes tepidamans]MDC7984849.1 hypothetical protein [Rhodoplanes sp. TEM]MDQ0358438.1 hypothetical protein [Rhodoplanes tepidamans]
MTKRKKPVTGQGDLFAYAAAVPAGALFPVRDRTAVLDVDISLKFKTALGRALREHHESAAVVAARMSEIVGRQITEAALYAFTAPAKPEHDIGIVRLKAFIRVTGATWLWDVLVEDDGLIVMQGREAHLAQLGLLQQEQQRVDEQIRALRRELKARPVAVAHRRSAR